MDPVELLALLGGVAEADSLVGRYRASRRALARAVTDGRILRVRRGCYALAGADPVRVAEVAWRGQSTCITAARVLGLPVLSRDNRLHLQTHRDRTFSGRNLRPPDNVRMHYVAAGAPGPLSIAEIVDAAGRCLPREQHLALVDAALNRRVLLASDILAFTSSSRTRVAWLVRHADERAESGVETLLRIEMRRLGLEVESQVLLEGVGRVDFVVDGRVIVEADGRAFHSDAVSFATDRRRDRAAAMAGMPVLRFTAAEIMTDARACALQVRDVVSLVARPEPKSRRIRLRSQVRTDPNTRGESFP